jgi:uncharacterized protein (TIGR03435 family)
MHQRPSPLLLASLALFCEPPAFTQTPAFEVASVKTAQDPGRVPSVCPLDCTPGERMTVVDLRVDVRFMSLRKLLLTAYRLKNYQLSGPDWMQTRRFDILAKMPDGASKDEIPAMLQVLLAERFRLAFHRESRELPVLGLVVGRNGPKLKEAEGDAAAPAAAPGDRSLYTPEGEAHIDSKGGVVVTAGLLGPMRGSMTNLDLLKVTMPQFAELIAAHADRPVIDMTGLKGSYEIHIVMQPPEPPAGGNQRDGSLPPSGSPPPVDFVGVAIRRTVEQLGLKLEARRVPIAMMTVDHLERDPTGN